MQPHMKKTLNPLALIIKATLLAFVITAVLIGCAGNPAYKTLLAVRHTADDVVDTYYLEVATGRMRTNDVPKVSRAYDAFQAAYRVALQAARGNSNTKPDTNILSQLNLVVRAVDAAHGGTP